jgi:hypothetical protein
MNATVFGHQLWTRKRDGKKYEVVRVGSHLGSDRIQLRPADATNLKNTNWLDADALLARYEPAEPLSLADQLATEIGLGAEVKVSVSLSFGGWSRDLSWSREAVEFVGRFDGTWSWMHVPANGDWYSLTVYGKVRGVSVKLHGPGGWTQLEARALTANLKAAKVRDEESRTPPPFAYEGAVA